MSDFKKTHLRYIKKLLCAPKEKQALKTVIRTLYLNAKN